MSMTMFYISLLMTIFCLLAVLVTPLMLRQAPENQRVIDVVSNNRVAPVSTEGRVKPGNLLEVLNGLRTKLGFSESGAVKRKLITAGLRKKSSSDLFYAFQMVLPLVGLVIGSFTPSNSVFWAGCLAVIGYIAPDFWLGKKIKARQNVIRRGLPDATDLLVICVEAGLGLDQALLRVGEETVISHPEIAEELTLVNLEQRAGKPRLEAWQSLADRTQVDEFNAFVSMLTQTERFGTPIIKTLSRFAEDLREQRRQRAEEMAAKTKIKIIFPLVLFIFPCIFIVLLAPAVLSIMDGLNQMGGK